jgi:hypothetical protein
MLAILVIQQRCHVSSACVFQSYILCAAQKEAYSLCKSLEPSVVIQHSKTYTYYVLTRPVRVAWCSHVMLVCMHAHMCDIALLGVQGGCVLGCFLVRADR